jgi:hypothetical protein
VWELEVTQKEEE